MSGREVTYGGVQGVRPGREATTGVNTGPGGTAQPARRWRRKNRAEAPMVPDATFTSYYGMPIINQPTWEAPDIAGYLFLGGLAGAGSVIAAGAQLTGRPMLARTMKCGGAAAAGLSLIALVHDLGRPARFLNMLRTIKPTSPMSIGSWLLGAWYAPAAVAAAVSDLTGIAPAAGAAATAAAAAGFSLIALVHDLGRPARFLNMLRTIKPTSPMSIGSWLLGAWYAPAAVAAAASDLTGIAPLAGAAATAAAAAAGPGVATYTAALIADTAVPAWHGGHRYLPFVFAASAVSAAAGLGLCGAPLAENEPVLRLGVLAGAAELVTEKVMERRMGLPGEAYEEGRAKHYGRAAQALTAAGVLTAAAAGRRSRVAAAAAGAALLAGSALTRFAIFEAGLNSAKDPKYTVIPQRQRLEARRGPRGSQAELPERIT